MSSRADKNVTHFSKPCSSNPRILRAVDAKTYQQYSSRDLSVLRLIAAIKESFWNEPSKKDMKRLQNHIREYDAHLAYLLTVRGGYTITEAIEKRLDKLEKKIEEAYKEKETVTEKPKQNGQRPPSQNRMQIPPPRKNSMKAIQNNVDEVVVLPQEPKPAPEVVTILSDEEDDKPTKLAQCRRIPVYKRARLISEETSSNMVRMSSSSMETPAPRKTKTSHRNQFQDDDDVRIIE